MATKVTTGLISADAALVDLNIDADTLYVDASANRVGMGTTTPSTALHVKGDELTLEDPGAGYKLHLNADTNPVTITANDNTGANFCGFRLRTNNGGAYPATAMHVYPHSSAHVGFGTDARTDTQMVISKNPSSATQTTPETILTLSTPCVTTASDIKVGQGPRLVFEIPDDQSGNKATGAAIAALKEVASDTNSQTTLAFYTSDDDETLDQRMTILSNGRVGIGDTTPDALLKVETTSTAIAGSWIRGGSYGLRVSAGSTSSHYALRVANGSDSDLMTVNGDGNVGIGTTSPTNKLDVNGAIRLMGTGTDNDSHILYFNNGACAIARDNNDLDIHAYNAMVFGVSNTAYPSSTERMRINSDGKLLIGTTSSDTSDVIQIQSPASGGGYGIQIRRNDSNTDQQLGQIKFGNTVDSDIGQLHVKTDGATNSGAMVFSTASSGTTSERMRIDNTGALLVGTTSHITTSEEECVHIKNGDGAGQLFLDNTRSSGNQYMVQIHRLGTRVGSIQTSTSGTSYLETSDYRLKENVDYEFNALERVAQLKPARFNFIKEPDVTVDGFLAHEVAPVVPQAVSGEKDAVDEEGNPDLQGIDHSKLVPLLTKAIQEQQTIIDDLKSRIETLEG